MSKLIPVQYKDLEYPPSITPKVGEVSVQFKHSENDIKISIEKMKGKSIEYYSLHTQEPYTNSKTIFSKMEKGSIVKEHGLENIKDSVNRDVSGDSYPNLWMSDEWTKEFGEFLEIVSGFFEERNRIRVVELHTPRRSKVSSIDEFMDRLKQFYNNVAPLFPKAEFVIENSYNKYFLFAKPEEIKVLSDRIDKEKKDCKNSFSNEYNDFRVGIALDIPQLLYSTELRRCTDDVTEVKIKNLFDELKSAQHNIISIHISGSRSKSEGCEKLGHSHSGDLYTLFDHKWSKENGDPSDKVKGLKLSLLEGINLILSDEKKRFMVPEINDKKSLPSIIDDLESVGIEFDPSVP
jgi:hypothetical protein